MEGSAELGITSTRISNEVPAAGANVFNVQVENRFDGYGKVSFQIELSSSYPLLTLASMLGLNPRLVRRSS